MGRKLFARGGGHVPRDPVANNYILLSFSQHKKTVAIDILSLLNFILCLPRTS